jgi:hypothetical protein
MALDASDLLGAKQLAGTPVNPRRMLPGQMTRSSRATGEESDGPLAGMFFKKNIDREHVEAAAPTTPDFGGHGFLALTADDIALLTIKQGLLTAKPAVVLARVPRADIAGVTLGAGMTPALSMLFDDGQAWWFELTRRTKYGAKIFLDVLSATG